MFKSKERKMKALAVIVIAIIGIMVTACSSLSSEELSDYYNMETVHRQLQKRIETEQYEEAMLFLVSTDTLKEKEVEKAKERFKDIIDSDVFVKIDRELREETLYEGEIEPFAEWEDGKKLEYDDAELDENEYPIYDYYYNIVGRGTKEESDESIDQWKSLPDNTIKAISTYRGKIVIKIDNKYVGEYMTTYKIGENGKITEYNIYM